MRLERHGCAPDLEAAFKEFVVSVLGGHALDDDRDQEASEGKFPDFTWLGGIVLIEMKSLETDQHDRLNEVLEKHIKPTEKPFFYGGREAHHILNEVSNGAEISAAIMNKLSRTIETHLSKANRQFSSYRVRHPRKNSVTVCVILNASLREFTPEVVLKAIHGKMKADRHGGARFPLIDAVLYISEKHYRRLSDGRVGLALGMYEGAGLLSHPWKHQFVERIAAAWSQMRTGSAVVESDDLNDFDLVHDIPDQMKRHEVWALEYQRNPYMRSWTVDRLRIAFQRCIAVKSLTLLKGSWPKPDRQSIIEGWRFFKHLVEETNRRGLDLRLLDQKLLSAADRDVVYAGLPVELVVLLTRGHPSNGTAS